MTQRYIGLLVLLTGTCILSNAENVGISIQKNGLLHSSKIEIKVSLKSMGVLDSIRFVV